MIAQIEHCRYKNSALKFKPQLKVKKFKIDWNIIMKYCHLTHVSMCINTSCTVCNKNSEGKAVEIEKSVLWANKNL